MTYIGAVALMAAVALGTWTGGSLELLARRLPDPGAPRLAGVTIRLRRHGAAAGAMVGGLIPFAAWIFTPTPAAAGAACVVGWLLLGIAIYDERTLQIPHVLWIGGIAAGLALGWCQAGWGGMAGRALTALGLAGGMRAAAALAGAVKRRAPVGAADYGVIGFVGALAGGTVSIDVVLVAGVIALAYLSPQPHAFGPRLLHGCVTAAGAALAAFGGPAGAGVAALGLVLLRPPAPARGASLPDAAAPFGACLVLAAIIVILGGATPTLQGMSALRNDLVLTHLLSDNR